jgi:hypothetical protein
MLCWASNSGVTNTGSGRTGEDAVFITIAFIVARESHSRTGFGVWKAGTCPRIGFAAGYIEIYPGKNQ